MDCARDFSFDEIEENSEFSCIYAIDDLAYDALATVFRDQSPIHTDDEYARTAGFSGRVMHGAILNGFLSNFVGMRFPGRRSLLLSVSLNYHKPSYLHDTIELTARVRQKVEAARTVALDVKFKNIERQEIAASGRVLVAVRNE